MPRYLDTLLQDESSEAKEFARYAYRDAETTVDYLHHQPRLATLAHWGIDEREWDLVGRGLHFEQLSASVSPRCPAIILAPYSETESLAHRLVILPGQEVRMQAVEDWIGREMEASDLGVLHQMAQVLPSGWMIVLEGRSHHNAQ